MRTLLAVLALAFLAGCDEDAAQPRPIDPKLRGPPPNRPPPVPPGMRGDARAAAPPPVAAPSPVPDTPREWTPYRDVPDPTAAELEGSILFEERSVNGLSMYEGELTITSDAQGAAVEEHSTMMGESPKHFRGLLSLEEARKLRAEVIALRPWALQNTNSPIDDATTSTVSIRLGSVSAKFTFEGGCHCSSSRPDREVPCACPQQELMGLLSAARANAREVPMAPPEPPVRQRGPPARPPKPSRQRP